MLTLTPGDPRVIPQFNAIRAALPLDRQEELAKMPEVRTIAPAAVAEYDTGSVTSEGDVAHAANTAWTTYPLITTHADSRSRLKPPVVSVT